MNFPVYFCLGPVQIHPHILFEALAYTISLRLLLYNRQDSIAPQQRSSVIVGGMVGALIGAKVLVLLQHINLIGQWQQFFLLLVQGKTVVGGLLGGLIGVELTKKAIGVNQSTGDAFVYPSIVGTAVGRIGCFLTGLSDRTYGIVTNLPWGVDFGDGPRHPTQLYEILFLLCLMLFLWVRSRYYRQAGDLFKFYMSAYLSFRFLIDFIKPDFHPILGMSAIQLACLCGLVYYRSSMTQLFKFTKPATRNWGLVK